MLDRPTATLALTTVVALALPTAAWGATLAPLKGCYVSVENPNMKGTPLDLEDIVLQGGGFTPGSRVDVTVDGRPAVTGAPVDAAGNLPAGLRADAPFNARGERAFDVVAAEEGNPANAVSRSSRVTALGVRVTPRDALSSRRVRFRGRGFTRGGRVYAHYRYNRKTRKTVAFDPKGACGSFSARRRQIPVAHPAVGTWLVQFDQQRRFAERPASALVKLIVEVTRRVRGGGG